MDVSRRPEARPDVGLCAACRHASRHGNTRGSEFWRCLRAETDPRFAGYPRYPRYPRLPVRECPGYEPAE